MRLHPQHNTVSAHDAVIHRLTLQGVQGRLTRLQKPFAVFSMHLIFIGGILAAGRQRPAQPDGIVAERECIGGNVPIENDDSRRRTCYCKLRIAFAQKLFTHGQRRSTLQHALVQLTARALQGALRRLILVNNHGETQRRNAR